MNSFIDGDKLEGINMLSGHRALCCGKHQFHASCEYLNCFRVIIVEQSDQNKALKERKNNKTKKALSLLHTFAFSCLP